MKKHLAVGTLAVLVCIAAIAGVGVASIARRYVVLDHQTTTQLLWNEERAYLFVGMRRDGWSGSQAEYLWQVIKGLMGNPFQFQESRTWLIVINVQSDGVHRSTHDRETFRPMQPFEGAVYTTHGPIRKWTEDQLEPVSAPEATRFKASPAYSQLSGYFSNVNGWSSQIMVLNRPEERAEYPLDLTSKRVVLVADRSDPKQPKLLIRRAAGAIEEIFSVDERFRTFSAEEYDALMHSPMKE